jgi:hypothetical protein
VRVMHVPIAAAVSGGGVGGDDVHADGGDGRGRRASMDSESGQRVTVRGVGIIVLEGPEGVRRAPAPTGAAAEAAPSAAGIAAMPKLLTLHAAYTPPADVATPDGASSATPLSAKLHRRHCVVTVDALLSGDLAPESAPAGKRDAGRVYRLSRSLQ